MTFSYFFKGLILIFIGLLAFTQVVCSHSPERIEGFITAIDQKENRVEINQQWFDLSEDAVVKQNGQPASLSGCAPIDSNFQQWGEGVLVEGQIKRLIVNYQVLEGKIEQVNLEKEYLEINTFQTPENEGRSLKFYLKDSPLNLNLNKFRDGDYLAVAVSNNKLLYVKLIK